MLIQEERRDRRRKRRFWVRSWLQRRPLYGQYEQLMHELEREDIAGYKNFIRMNPVKFYELLTRLGDRLHKTDTFARKALEPALKLAIALRYFASGDNYHSLMYSFRVGHNTISKIIREVCTVIIDELAMEVIDCPTTPQEWLQIADLFASRWQFHNALGALDGKHIAIRCPPNGGSQYFNYKVFEL